jgi:hypothetical protein
MCNYISCEQDNIDARVVVAGLSTTCSQKIHNQLVCNKFTISLLVSSTTSYTVTLTSFVFILRFCVLQCDAMQHLLLGQVYI